VVIAPLRTLRGKIGAVLAGHNNSLPLPADGHFVLRAVADQLAVGIENLRLWRSELRRAQSLASTLADSRSELSNLNQRLSAEVQAHEQAQRALVSSQRLELVGTLTSGLAHDFGNLLYGIIGCMEMVSGFVEHGPANRYLNEARRAAEESLRYIKQLLCFARQGTQLESTQSDLCAVVSGMETMLRRVLGSRIDLELRLPPGPVLVSAPASSLEHALMNFAINGRDAMSERGELTIEISEEMVESGDHNARPHMAPGRYGRMAVSDTGCGIDPAVQERIFDRFFSTKAPEQGNGLGLWMTRRLVEEAGGYVFASNLPGKGARFTVLLPLASVASPARG
jgi:signal transduction histidine kinase